MLKLAIRFFWLFIPLVLAFFYARYKIRTGQDVPRYLWHTAISITLLMLVAIIIGFVLFNQNNTDHRYVAPKYENGEMVPSQLIPNDK